MDDKSRKEVAGYMPRDQAEALRRNAQDAQAGIVNAAFDEALRAIARHSVPPNCMVEALYETRRSGEYEVLSTFRAWYLGCWEVGGGSSPVGTKRHACIDEKGRILLGEFEGARRAFTIRVYKKPGPFRKLPIEDERSRVSLSDLRELIEQVTSEYGTGG